MKHAINDKPVVKDGEYDEAGVEHSQGEKEAVEGVAHISLDMEIEILELETISRLLCLPLLKL